MRKIFVFWTSQYRWVRRQKALQSEAWVKCCFGCIKQKGTTPDLAPYDDEPRPLRQLRSEIAALRATLPDRPTGTTPRGLPAGTVSPIPPAKHRGPGRLMSRKPGERPPREVPFSRATAGIAERGGEERGAIGSRAPVSPPPPPARSGTRSPATSLRLGRYPGRLKNGTRKSRCSWWNAYIYRESKTKKRFTFAHP